MKLQAYFNILNMKLTQEIIEKFVGNRVRVTTVDQAVFEGSIRHVEYGEKAEDEKKTLVRGIILDSQDIGFRPEHIQNIRLL